MMASAQWTQEQLAVINSASTGSLFLQGPAGSGKTTASVQRLLALVSSGVDASSILILVPQRTLAQPYYKAIQANAFPSGGVPEILTLGGLSQRLINLFWPIIARQSGFSNPLRPLTFLTLETAQFYLARLVKPLLDEGFFDSVTIDRSRLYSQILDNLNKAAVVGFSHTEIADRLTQAWVGDPSQTRIYRDAQECANRFRSFCQQNNLLDFSLQFELFRDHIWRSFLCREFLFARYRHLIYDNVEEDVPIAHDTIREWLPHFSSALLIGDFDGGYRSFLGADPESGLSLQSFCDRVVTLTQSWISSPELESFSRSLRSQILHSPPASPLPETRRVVQFSTYTFIPQMVDGVANQILDLVQQGVQPGEIAVLAPFLSDSLRFSLMDRLQQLDVPYYSHRPSRRLSDEPATRCLLTLARLAHPQWSKPISRLDLRHSLMQSIEGLVLPRAELLSQIVFRRGQNDIHLGSFDVIRPEIQQRITYSIGERYQMLAAWLSAYQTGTPEELDVFLSRLFGEILSQPGFGFHDNFDAASVAARLIESVQKFRWALTEINTGSRSSTGQDYVEMVEEGVIASQYIHAWFDQPENSVFIAPAYTFLMTNRAVSFQFWLDIGSQGWWERLYQPLTHPYVLSRHWNEGQVWTDSFEYQINQSLLSHLTSGLIARCQRGINLCFLGVNEQGREQRGMLLTALQNIQRRLMAREVGIV